MKNTMQALRQYYTVQGNTVVVRLPEDFSATEIEVIILPSNGTSGEASEKIASLDTHIEAWRNKNNTPPPLPVWTPEQRASALRLSQDTTTMTDEEVAEWEKEIALMRSLPSLGWENE